MPKQTTDGRGGGSSARDLARHASALGPGREDPRRAGLREPARRRGFGGRAAEGRRGARSSSRRGTVFAASSARSTIEGLLAQVEIDVTEPARVVAIITRESAEQLALKPGMSAAGVVKSTSVMVER